MTIPAKHSPSTLALALRLHAEMTAEIEDRKLREDAVAFGIERPVSDR